MNMLNLFRRKSVVVFCLGIALSLQAKAQESCQLSFETALDQLMAALYDRNLKQYMSILPDHEDQLVILPDGNTWATRTEIEKGHEQWFKDKTWELNRELIRKDVRDMWGLVVYRVSVDRPNSPGKPFLLSLMFAPEQDGCWYLQHDQNTLLPQAGSE